MAEEPRLSPPPGSIRSLLAGLISLTLTRAELFGIEAHEQQERLIGHLLVGVAALVATLIGLMAGLLFTMVITPPEWRAQVMGGLALLFLLVSVSFFWYLARRLTQAPAPFALSLAEVKKDWHALSGKEES